MDVLCSNLVCYQFFFLVQLLGINSFSLSLSRYIIINFVKKEQIYNKIKPSPFIRLQIQKRKGMKNIIHATELLLIHDSINLSNHRRMLFGNYMNDWAICLKLAYLLNVTHFISYFSK